MQVQERPQKQALEKLRWRRRQVHPARSRTRMAVSPFQMQTELIRMTELQKQTLVSRDTYTSARRQRRVWKLRIELLMWRSHCLQRQRPLLEQQPLRPAQTVRPMLAQQLVRHHHHPVPCLRIQLCRRGYRRMVQVRVCWKRSSMCPRQPCPRAAQSPY